MEYYLLDNVQLLKNFKQESRKSDFRMRKFIWGVVWIKGKQKVEIE